jgi:PAS domain S-box-containing protein
MKISLVLAIVFLGTIAVLGSFAIYVLEENINKLRETEVEKLQSRVDYYAQTYSLKIDSDVEDSIALSDSVIGLLDSERIDIKKLATYFRENYSIRTDVDSVAIYDDAGIKIIDTRNLSIGEKLNSEIQREISQNDIWVGAPEFTTNVEKSVISVDHPFYTIGSKIQGGDGKDKGFLIFQISIWDTLESIIFADEVGPIVTLEDTSGQILINKIRYNEIINSNKKLIQVQQDVPSGEFFNPSVPLVVKITIDEGIILGELEQSRTITYAVILAMIGVIIVIISIFGRKVQGQISQIISNLDNVEKGKQIVQKNLQSFSEFREIEKKIDSVGENLKKERKGNKSKLEFLDEMFLAIEGIGTGEFSNKIAQKEDEFVRTRKLVNEMYGFLEKFSSSLSETAIQVGQEGNFDVKLASQDSLGIWKNLQESVVTLEDNFKSQIREMIEFTRNIASKNYNIQSNVSQKGEFGKLRNSLDSMRDQLVETQKYYDELTVLNNIIEKSTLVIKTTQSGEIITSNKIFLESTGFQYGDISTKTITDFMEDGFNVYHKVIEALKTEQIWEGSVKIKKADGGVVWTQLFASRNITDTFSGYTWVGIDITKQVEYGLQMEKLDKEKSEFATIMSHELKSPVTAAMYNCKILLSPSIPADEMVKDTVKSIHENLQSLSSLITDAFDAQKLDLNKMIFRMEEVQVNEIFEKIKKDFTPLADENKIQLVINQADFKVTIDRNRINQVFSNLLKNSIDFTSEGKSIEVGATKLGDMVQFYVKDEGIGIPKDKQSGLFKKFYQVDASKTRKHGGTGLGLVVCKGIVENHGGRIWFKSEPDKGTTFFFTIPISKYYVEIEKATPKTSD